MGEFLVDATIFEDKMGENATSSPALQVSVSFGRFENDSLSWERWSSFSPNKYLEEVEKCATPGSVAQKRAYFEAHYKKVAARKAELLAQEKQFEKDSFRSEDQNGIDLSGNTSGTDAEYDISNTQGSIEGVKQETGSVGEIHRTHVNDSEEEVAVSRDCQSSSLEVENKELESRSHSSFQIDEHKEDVCMKQEESLNSEAENVKEVSHVVYKETGKVSEVKAKDVKLYHPKESKVNSVKRDSNATKTKKKSMLPTSKASQISTLKSSKPTSTPTKTVTPSSTKKGNSSSLSRRQITSSVENKKIANKSLHMSLSLGPNNPDPAPHTAMRKSLIMEKMGDKDIVKRAFKTFQNSFNQPKSSGEDISLIKKQQVPSRVTVSKVPTATALRKENGRSTKVENIDKRNGNVVRTTLGPKSDIRAEKGKESPRKIEEKSNAKEVDRMRLQSKLKEGKEEEMKRLKHNVKATPLPALYRGQKASKSRLEKGDAKTEKSR
ncbi:protein WVD2-like 7 isoform X2 [Abrus precatorius]|uniref:Protein WVD2-like 7 isoform X2 n=1 Tax=Abrus precatorius TaxID=3816 RepID=A0A8B8LXD3_ABRPR|nr:protein WVD2-like 7 isoform X2 [Abrus precatorius]